MSTMIDDPRLIADAGGVRGLLSFAARRLRQGELGPLPVVLGLVVIAVIFQSLNSNFLTALNITNLMLQIAPIGVISVGIVLVLLLGEIDLSVAYVSAFCAAIMAVLDFKHGVAAPLALLAGIAMGTVIGSFIGVMRAKVQVPSFIVTLAGYIAFQGALLYTLGTTGTINTNTDKFIVALANRLLPVWLGWAFAIGFIVMVLASAVYGRRRRVASGLRPEPWILLGARVGILAVIALVLVGLMNTDRSRGVIPIQGVPLGVLIFLAFVVGFELITQHTLFGRHIYAVGGGEEAARRAGIDVDGIRIAVFAIASTLAACGGMLDASRGLSVSQSSGGGDVLLDAIAAAVIGGVSLFGGRGRVFSALLGSLVIGSIANGMDLLALSSSVKFMITGGVLLAAVTIDAVSRRGRAAAGRV